jgi:DNA-binding MarR family transcriptional regulator
MVKSDQSSSSSRAARCSRRRGGERRHGVALFVTTSGEAARREADRCKSELEDELAATLGRRAYEGLVRSLMRARPLVAELALTPRGR